MNKEGKYNFDSDFDQWLQKNNPKKGMSVPEGYFENFSDDLMSKIEFNKIDAPVSRHLLSIKSKYYISAIAASIILLVASIIFFPQEKDNIVLTDLAADQTWGYVINNASELSMEEISEFSEIDEAITDLEKELYGNNISEHFIDDQDIDLIEEIYQ